ncbi:MAG: hypothetical protein ACJASX_000546 [Limisphaerales bacterium]|jgi:hypothetical protein
MSALKGSNFSIGSKVSLVVIGLALVLTTTISAAVKWFPKSWGEPPRIQTRDYVKLPADFGHGSSTLANWIKRNLANAARFQTNPAYSRFPKHWGPPPRRQTADMVPLPGGYGRGSSTLARWIKAHLGSAVVKQPAALKSLYASDLSKENTGELDFDRFMVLDGAFSVKEAAGNRFIELPGAPLDSFGVLFGPSEATNVMAQVKVFGTNNKRRYPAFGLGLNGVGGYRIQVSASKRALELFRQDAVVTKIPYRWVPGTWTWLKLQVTKLEKTWRVDGKAWTDGSPEPGAWMISYDDKEEPFAGMAGIWGQPYAGTPIRFDELAVFTLGK